MRIDEMTTLMRIEGKGTTLRYLYELSADIDTLSTVLRRRVIQHNCTYEALLPVIDAGATIEHVYHREDGSEIGTVKVSRELCGPR